MEDLNDAEDEVHEPQCGELFFVEAMDVEATACPRCAKDCDCDYKTMLEDSRTDMRIPLSCVFCGFSICHLCVLALHAKYISKLNRMSDHIECPCSACMKFQGIPVARPRPNILACKILQSLCNNMHEQDDSGPSNDDDSDKDEDKKNDSEDTNNNKKSPKRARKDSNDDTASNESPRMIAQA